MPEDSVKWFIHYGIFCKIHSTRLAGKYPHQCYHHAFNINLSRIQQKYLKKKKNNLNMEVLQEGDIELYAGIKIEVDSSWF